ncbi:hypothetical protein RJ640_003345 [Escallonia rubra]|uniref:Uncharacterized protein n=1 Tax=Escallonia rubra TaxID=112253 RepID=A0AA88S0H8_9ASTE|nr:hypothetical protein RJ640_003345 [Escallonia rubra]
MGLISALLQEIANLTFLVLFDISYSNFSGEISSTLSKCWKLRQASLEENKSSRSIPSGVIGNLTKLEEIYLDENHFEGQIPKETSSPTNLRRLYLLDDNLEGPIPAAIFNISSLQKLRLGGNSLHGTLPADIGIGDLSNLVALGPGRNDFRRPLPGILEKLGKIQQLSIDDTEVHGLVPKGVLHCVERLSSMSRRLTISVKTIDWEGKHQLGLHKGIFSHELVAAVKVFKIDLQTTFKSFEAVCEVMCSICHRNFVKVISSCSNPDFKPLLLAYMPILPSKRWFLDFDKVDGISPSQVDQVKGFDQTAKAAFGRSSKLGMASDF